MSTGVRRLSEKIFAERIAAGGIEALWNHDLFEGLLMGSLDETSKDPSLEPGRSSGLRRVRREGEGDDAVRADRSASPKRPQAAREPRHGA